MCDETVYMCRLLENSFYSVAKSNRRKNKLTKSIACLYINAIPTTICIHLVYYTKQPTFQWYR